MYIGKIEVHIRKNYKLIAEPTEIQKNALACLFVPFGMTYWKEIVKSQKCLFTKHGNVFFVKLKKGWCYVNYDEHKQKLYVENFKI